MTIPHAFLRSEQTYAIAVTRYVALMSCSGFCHFVGLDSRLRLSAIGLYQEVNDIINMEKLVEGTHRHKRYYLDYERVYLDATEQPKGIPDEFKQEMRSKQ